MERPQRLQDLEKFVKEGGGLMVFAGPECDVRASGNGFFRRWPRLASRFRSKAFGHAEWKARTLRASCCNASRILPRRISTSARRWRSFKTRRVERWLQLEPKSDEVKTLFTLDRGAPLFLGEDRRAGDASSPARPVRIPSGPTCRCRWSSVPLVQRLVSYLGTP